MSETLKEKTAKGLFWGGLSNGVQQLLGLLFGIIERSDQNFERVIWGGDPICKITDANGRLLYRDSNGDTPADYSVLTDLVNPLLTCPISDMEKGDNYIQLSSAFSNSDVASDFQLKEIGVFAMDQDGVTLENLDPNVEYANASAVNGFIMEPGV